MSLTAQTTVGQWVTDKPARARVFERLGIDYCCGGRLPLADACAKKGLDPQIVVRELLDIAPSIEPEIDWAAQGPAALAEHIEQTHHAYLKRELPRITALTTKVAAVHGPSRASLLEVRDVFASFAYEMTAHMTKEERVLFPWIKSLASGAAPASGGISNPIRMMMAEHDSSGEALARLRELTDNYTPPLDACNTYRAMIDALAQLESDTHTHVHKENNILFPMALKLEEAQADPSSCSCSCSCRVADH